MLKYILSLSLLFNGLVLVGQLKEVKTQEQKTTGFSVGINLAPYIIQAFEKERIGFEANARYVFNKKWQAVGEVGYEHVDFEKPEYKYKSDGSFLRLGFDYNFFKVEEIGNADNILAGIRYGTGFQRHESPFFTIEDKFWGNLEDNQGLPLTSVNSHWVEFIFGLRSEILKNFYMGWSVRLKRLIVINNDGVLEPYTIPGYGHRDNETNLSFSYTLEYYIPFKSKK